MREYGRVVEDDRKQNEKCTRTVACKRYLNKRGGHTVLVLAAKSMTKLMEHLATDVVLRVVHVDVQVS
jgi:hypothetical protein